MLHEPRDLFLVHVYPDALDILGADRADRRRRLGGKEPVEGDDADEVVVIVHDVEVEVALARCRLADVLDRLGDGRLFPHGDELGRHQPARRALLVFEELLDLLGLLLLHELEDFFCLRLGQLLDNVHDVLRRHTIEDA